MAEKREPNERRDEGVSSLPGQARIDTQHDGTSPATTLPDVDALGIGSAPTKVLADSPTAGRESGPSEGGGRSSFTGQIGRFSYVRILGKGAFGTVLQVWDPELQTHRAVKIPHRELLSSGRVDPESYVREARKVVQLGKHPGIVEVLDVQRMEDGTPFVVSEYISGGSLAERIKASRLPWREAAEVVAHIAEGISHAHSKGIVHRDLKPGNILLTDEGRPVVVDFGLALGDAEFSYKSSVCGTYHYMSPQQVRGQADRVDGRSDIYSLGVILYQLLSGRMPYKSQTIEALKREILEDTPTPVRQYNPEVPPELEAICQKAMSKEPRERYSTAADLAKALRGAVQESTASGIAMQPASVAQRPQWIPLAAAAAAFLAVAAVVWSMFGSRPEPVPVPASTMATPDLAVHFQKAGEEVFDKSFSRADLPLAVGDKVQFHAELPEPMYAYLYWVASDGEPQRVWPATEHDLETQQPVSQLSSPPGADKESRPNWWQIPETGGPQVFFLGVTPNKLDEKTLREFEAQTAFMRSLLPADEKVVEFEFPEQPGKYDENERGRFRTRGAELVKVVSPKLYATDHSHLKKWFAAYHGWIVATKPQ